MSCIIAELSIAEIFVIEEAQAVEGLIGKAERRKRHKETKKTECKQQRKDV